MSSNYRNFYCFAAHVPRSPALRLRLIMTVPFKKAPKKFGARPRAPYGDVPARGNHIWLSFLSKVPSVQVIVKDPVLLFHSVPLSIALHCSTVPWKVMLSSNPQPMNAYSPMLVTPSGIVMLVSEMQADNAKLPILVTPSGISSEVTSSPLR